MSAKWIGLFAAVTQVLAGCTTPCGPGGTGDVVVVFEGLPAGAMGSATFTGPSSQTVTSGQTLSGVGSGDWTVTAQKVIQADARVRTAFGPAISRSSFCLSNRGSETITVTWAAIPTSNKLWASNGSGGTGSLLGFASSLLETGTPRASVSAKTPGGGDVAFDKDGNLWATGGTTADPTLVRFSAATLNSSGEKVPDRKIEIADINCLPRVSGLAFDPNGNLIVASPCRKRVYVLTATQLLASGSVTAGSALAADGVTGIAYDANGVFWMASAGDEKLTRSAPGAVDSGSLAAHLQVRASADPLNNALYKPSWIAFDADGNLWGNDFGANVIFKVAKADLAGTGTYQVAPAVRITIGVTALLEGMAFDEGGGLWFAYSAGKLARLDPSQLTVSSSAGAPTTPATIIDSTDLGYAGSVAFYPAPAGTPLFHRLP